MYILNSNLDMLECDACYSVDDVEYAAYIGGNEVVALINTADGSLATDIESFYISHITESINNLTYHLEFHSENFKEVLKDYSIDVDLLSKESRCSYE